MTRQAPGARQKAGQEAFQNVKDLTHPMRRNPADVVFLEDRALPGPRPLAPPAPPEPCGSVEGQITRLKLIKGQGYGRAKLDLLQARLLAA